MTRFLLMARKARVVGLLGWLLADPTAVAEEAVGRLFFTPERRQQLDQRREMNTLDEPQIATDSTLTVNGIITRSSGKRTVWINGNPQHEDETGNDLTVTTQRGNPGRVVVRSGAFPVTRARVGETVNRDTGKANDLLNGGQVRVQSGSRATK